MNEIKKRERRRRIGQILVTIALICYVAFIFHNSMESGEKSSTRSGFFTETVNEFLGKIGMGPMTEHMIRKTAHFLEYTGEGVLLLLLLWIYGLHPLRYFGWGLLGGVLTALTDESIQLFTDGRSGQVTDVWIDTGGVLWGMLVTLGILLVIRRGEIHGGVHRIC